MRISIDIDKSEPATLEWDSETPDIVTIAYGGMADEEAVSVASEDLFRAVDEMRDFLRSPKR